MCPSDNKKVTRFIDDLQVHTNHQYNIVKAIRALVVAQHPDLCESIKYGGLVYQKSNELVAGLFAYKNHVSLELGRGFEVEDVYCVLEGSGKYRRHIKFHDLADIKAKHAEYYIQAAMTQ